MTLKSKWTVQLEFGPRRFYLGVHWEEGRDGNWVPDNYTPMRLCPVTLHVWICLIPFFPVHVTRKRWVEAKP